MKPILFNTDMVRALLANRKTVTRRVVKLKYSNTHLEMFTNKYGTRLIEKQNEEPGITTIKNPDGTTTHTLLAYIEKEPPYRPGDILYVRETYAPLYPDLTSSDVVGYIYKADPLSVEDYDRRFPNGKDYQWEGRWRPSIHMPREAARIFLRVTNVYPQQLRDATEADARDEGFNSLTEFMSAILKMYPDSAEDGWFWVNEFERISREEAEMI